MVWLEYLLTIVSPKRDIALSVESNRLFIVRIGISTVIVLRSVEGSGLSVIHLSEGLCALSQLLLILCNRIVSGTPVGSLLRIKADVKEEFLIRIFRRVILQVDCLCIASSTVQVLEGAILYRFTISKERPFKIELVEVAVKILIRQFDLTLLSIQVEAYPLINTLHLIELSTPCTIGIDQSVVNEVILVRTRTVVSRDVSREPILSQLIVLYSVVGVDALVNPVPDATTNTHLRTFHSLPVLTQIAHGITHSMGILAHKVRFVRLRMVHIFNHRTRCFAALGIHCRIHNRVEISALSIVSRSTLIVDITVIELTNGVVGRHDVHTRATLVAKTPKDNTRMVAVAERITYVSIYDSTCPIRVVDDGLWSIPVLMQLHVSLINNKETVVVEHSHHLWLTRIMAGTNGIHVTLLHHRYIL